MDRNEPQEQQKSREVLRKIRDNYRGVLSTQVVQEFFVAATKKLGVDALQVKNILHHFANLEVVTISPELIYEAIDCHLVNQLSFWGSLIVVAAKNAKCGEIWTEELNAGQIIMGIQIVNPLR